jgi:hypothetical protein
MADVSFQVGLPPPARTVLVNLTPDRRKEDPFHTG